jgi:DtxR family transcriptional regulator, Mn-dependent transcriptional regulator
MTQILILLLIALVLLLIFVPRWGLLARGRAWRAAVERERVQDALKLLLDEQWQLHEISLSDLSARLHLSDKAGLRLVSRMQTQGLTQMSGSNLRLTTEGRQAALQIVRAHRLLERYLATEARMPLDQVHRQAHRMEHTLSATAVDQLDADLGYPRRDPHGDPIPGPGAELPVADGVALTAWAIDQPGKIVHLEDEPPLAYAQILAEGLRLGQTVRLLENTPQRCVLTDGEVEYRLAPAVAANIFIEPLRGEALAQPGLVTLDALGPKHKGEIVALDEACQGFTRRRFLDLGLTPGTEIYPELLNAFGDPRAYRVRGTLIALRRDQASQVWVRPLNGALTGGSHVAN